jgi:hypothetical protein
MNLSKIQFINLLSFGHNNYKKVIMIFSILVLLFSIFQNEANAMSSGVHNHCYAVCRGNEGRCIGGCWEDNFLTCDNDCTEDLFKCNRECQNPECRKNCRKEDLACARNCTEKIGETNMCVYQCSSEQLACSRDCDRLPECFSSADCGRNYACDDNQCKRMCDTFGVPAQCPRGYVCNEHMKRCVPDGFIER